MSNRLRRNLDYTVELLKWALYSIGLPLSPMVLALFIFGAREGGISIADLLGGTELYLVCVTVFAATYIDLEKSDVDFSQSPVHKGLKALLFPTAAIIAMLFGVVFVNDHATRCVMCEADALSDFDVPAELSWLLQLLFLPKSYIANFAIGIGIVTSLICGGLRLILIAAELTEDGA